jgi:hypothetical protein
MTYAVFLRFQATNPARPVPRRIMVLGSGTGFVAGPENLLMVVMAGPKLLSTEYCRKPISLLLSLVNGERNLIRVGGVITLKRGGWEKDTGFPNCKIS